MLKRKVSSTFKRKITLEIQERIYLFKFPLKGRRRERSESQDLIEAVRRRSALSGVTLTAQQRRPD